MQNLLPPAGNATLLNATIPHLRDRLNTLTLVLKTCKGKSCYDPWSALDPSGQTQTLEDALNPKFDAFYAGQPKVQMECAAGYLIQNELPIDYMTFGNHSTVEARNAEAWQNWLLFTD